MPGLIAIIIIGSVGVVAAYYVYENSLQPNIQAIAVNIHTPVTDPETTTWLNLGRVSNMGSFNYQVTLSGEYVLVFGNTFSWLSDKFVNLTYTTHWPDYQWTSFYVTAGNSETVQVHVNAGQQFGGDFWVSGGSGNDVDFRIVAYTCTENVSFTFSLINAGSSDGFADVVFTVDGASAWSNKYFVPQGSTLPMNGSIIINNCDTHTFNIVVQKQYKP
jgi:hypothetical protein